jgi:phosphoribosylamine---glycine ligase
MKVLVVGKGAREHALAWKIAQSEIVNKVYAYPGNAGISEVAEIPVLKDDSIETLCEFALSEKIDLTVVGPEDYLAKGITDLFESKGLKIFGVNRSAAFLESSKAFAKEIMTSANIPTASFHTVTDMEAGTNILEKSSFPIVLKADGLAAGKGVVICDNLDTATKELSEMLQGKFKDAGAKVVIEQFLKGEELSLLLLTDGTNVKKLLFSQDHKALSEGDKGPNTGGMGAYTPVSFANESLYEKVNLLVTLPLLNELKKRNIDYRGVLYIGLMIVDKTPYVLEYNARFGDPETEPLMFMLESDIVPYFKACIERTLDKLPEMRWYDGYGATVVMASGGYPDSYPKGVEIKGLDTVDSDCTVFHAGTIYKGNSILTDGGRVLMVTGRGKTAQDAMSKVYRNVEKITFDGSYYRKDIGYREIQRNKNDN